MRSPQNERSAGRIVYSGFTMTLPSLESLRCFDAAARLLRFRAAAKAVHLTPAALGHRIRQLEAELGVRLFERTTRRGRLTSAGPPAGPDRAPLPAAARTCF